MAVTITNALKKQQLATDPNASVWVNASAGTGKTKVLTDRILTLLLHGADPIKVLCLTFTKAAAAEMLNRLSERLSQWVLLDDHALTQQLSSIQTYPVTTAMLVKARSLFTEILETPGGMRIQTIHGFCQMLLQRFAIEANVPSAFTILNDQEAQDLLYQALTTILKSDDTLRLWHALIHRYFKDQTFIALLQDLLGQRQRLLKLQQDHGCPDRYESHLKTTLNLPTSWDLTSPDLEQQLILDACQYSLIPSDSSVELPILSQWLSGSLEQRQSLFSDYCGLFLTKDGEISKRPKVKHEGEAERLYGVMQQLNGLHVAQKSLLIMSFGLRISHHYQMIKAQKNCLDYDDLIDKCLNLLRQSQISAWILYKLDGGINHILIDEAQDTSPEQWQIIRIITEELFNNTNRHRSLFVVGDGKQSIYSFQGANPQDFIDLQKFFGNHLTNLGIEWRQLDLDVSFRSTPAVLELVDQIFHRPERLGPALVTQGVKHIPFRECHQGVVSLWPAVTEDDSSLPQSPEGWVIPRDRLEQHTLVRRFCDHLCQNIKALLRSQVQLPSTKQPIQPKDILILVRQRGELMLELISTLKREGIPVMGADRFVLTNHIIVQDLMALGQFLLLPDDDLSLACVLRSPIIGLDEEELMALAVGRSSSLWGQLKNQHNNSLSLRRTYDVLASLLAMVDFYSPYVMYEAVLHSYSGRRHFVSRLGPEASDILNEFLSIAYEFENNHQATLEEFLYALQQHEVTIKRDSNDQTSNQIRLMTIHGSKGLQAPVVILAEKFSSTDPQDKLLWQLDAAGQCRLMLARPTQRQDNALTSAMKHHWHQLDTYEDQRLLYVALTRAADHLYITGYGPKITADSWYQQIIEIINPPIEPWQQDHGTWQQQPTATSLNESRPEWLLMPIKQSLPRKPVTTQSTMTTAMHRGIVIHKLFEVLGDLAEGDRLKAGNYLLQHLKLSPCQWQQDLTRVLELLKDENLTIFYSAQSYAELEIAHPNGQLLRLDRVVISDDAIVILDYKTAEEIPDHIPATIIQQLSMYQEALNALYPNIPISSSILWTSGPELQNVPAELINTALKNVINS